MKKILLTLLALFFLINVCSNANTTLNNSNSASFEKLLTDNDEENAVIYYGMANVYSEMKDHKNAIKYYTKAIESNPKFVQAYIGKAKDCGDLGDYKCSLENYEILKNMYPDEHPFYYMTALYKTNTRDLDGAMDDIDKAISMIKKPNATYYTQKAWIYYEKKDYNDAIEYLRKSLKIDSNDPYALGLFMFMAADNEDYKMVIKTARRLLKVDPASNYNHALYATYAKALYLTGKKNEALKQLDKAIEIEPSDKDYPLLKEKMLRGEKID